MTQTSVAPTPRPKIGACPSAYRDSGGQRRRRTGRRSRCPKPGNARRTGCNRAPTALRCGGAEPRVMLALSAQGDSRPPRKARPSVRLRWRRLQ
jgi:hypothetical protein